MDAFKKALRTTAKLSATWAHGLAIAASVLRRAIWNPAPRDDALDRAASTLRVLGPAALLLIVIGVAQADASGGTLRPLGQPAGVTEATAPRIEARATGLFAIRIELSQKIDFDPFVLKAEPGKPHRVVLDLSQVAWRGGPTGAEESPEILGLRFGLFQPGRSRIALDVAGPATIVSATMTPESDRGPAALEFLIHVDLGNNAPQPIAPPPATPAEPAASVKPMTPTAQEKPKAYDPAAIATATIDLRPTRRPVRRGEAARAAQQAVAAAQAAESAPAFTEAVASGDLSTESIPTTALESTASARPSAQSRAPMVAPLPAPSPRRCSRVPTIVIDPGHGGHDSGATYGGVEEKDLVLELAKDLRRRLNRPMELHVYLTRTTDIFIPLDERGERARKLCAALFISLHADALPNNPEVSGASIYTLAQDASAALAARNAKSSNLTEQVAPRTKARMAGAIGRKVGQDARRMAELFIAEFEAGGLDLVPSRPHRKAKFVVLQNFDTPSVLIEVGFLTNPGDRRKFGSPEWRTATVDAIARAVDRWVARDHQ